VLLPWRWFRWQPGPLLPHLVEGKDFRPLAKPQPTETGKKIEVIEFFSFSCPHCRDLEPFLTAWIQKLPADVQLRRIPAQFSPQWVGTAKIWYTLEGLNEEKLVPAVFAALHSQNMRLDQDKVFLDWIATQGVDRKKAEDMYNSFAVNGKVTRAKALVQTYGIQSVPRLSWKASTTTDYRAGQASRGHSGTPRQVDRQGTSRAQVIGVCPDPDIAAGPVARRIRDENLSDRRFQRIGVALARCYAAGRAA
jgi:thiol:disulfide interchange protein DsbA